MDEKKYFSLLRQIDFGKKLRGAIYIHWSTLDSIPPELAQLVRSLDCVVVHSTEVIKFNTRKPRITFCDYTPFGIHSHPALQQSTVVTFDLKSRRRRYVKNPPIIHRKETMFPDTGKSIIKEWEKLTELEESYGLYDDTTIIGTMNNWNHLVNDLVNDPFHATNMYA